MNNFIIAIILLSLTVIFTGANSLIIGSVCDEIDELLDAGKTQEALDLWEKRRDYISVFVRDAEIDVVSAEAEGLSPDIPLEDGEAEAAKMRLREAIDELRHSEKPSFNNIFIIDFVR